MAGGDAVSGSELDGAALRQELAEVQERLELLEEAISTRFDAMEKRMMLIQSFTLVIVVAVLAFSFRIFGAG